jgi:glycosyltransferase involved in cell wall biosynthesis
MNLTIIIPVFNSEKYVIQSLTSLSKLIKKTSGGAIVIDDGSHDNSLNLIKDYKKKNKLKIRIVKLKINYGAGYAKNYGIILSKTKYVLVCDSDNIYNYESISKLYFFLINNNAFQAAHIQKSLHFYDKSINNSFTIHDMYKNLKNVNYVNIDTMIRNKIILDNFMMTKKSYLRSRGYPITHGFDTQGLGINYLLVNKKIAIVKDTYYKHRLHKKNKSYYAREASINRFGINFYLIFESLLKYKKDILNNLFKVKLFSENQDLFKYLNLEKRKNTDRKNLQITKIFYSWYSSFKKKKFRKCINLSSRLLQNTNFSDLSIYLVFRSYFYKFKPFNIGNDILCYELLRNFYKDRDHRPLKEKVINKFKNFFKYNF